MKNKILGVIVGIACVASIAWLAVPVLAGGICRMNGNQVNAAADCCQTSTPAVQTDEVAACCDTAAPIAATQTADVPNCCQTVAPAVQADATAACCQTGTPAPAPAANGSCCVK